MYYKSPKAVHNTAIIPLKQTEIRNYITNPQSYEFRDRFKTRDIRGKSSP